MDECLPLVLTGQKQSTNSAIISCCKVGYSVAQNRGKPPKIILQDISAIFKPGLNAIMGPSGSGKSTLLSVLGNQINRNNISGNVFLNGKVQPEDFHLMSGFVPQDDVVMGTLTVQENVAFSASLRLPRYLNKVQREGRVSTLLKGMQLEKVADCRVGTPLIRGISGGERKRTAVCMELIKHPQVLFLDEPTTGLDAATATDVMRLLKREADSGLTVIFTIHQPRYSIFKMFDTLTLLKDGRAVFHGPSSESMPYFERLGYKCSEHNNPADFLLDVVQGHERPQSFSMGIEHLLSEDFLSEGSPVNLLATCQGSAYFADLETWLPALVHKSAPLPKANVVEKTLAYEASFIRQLMLVSWRALMNYFREPRLAAAQLIFMLYFATWLVVAYFRMGLRNEDMQNRSGAFYYIMDYALWNNIDIAPIFIEERPIFIHESANGYYRVSAYFLAKVLADFVVIRTIPYLFFSVFTYFVIGLQSSWMHFLRFYASVVGVSYASCGIMICVSCSTNSPLIAHMVITVVMVFSLLLGGFMVNLRDLPVYIRWFKYLSVMQYGYSNLQANEMHGLKFSCTDNVTYCPTGDDFLSSQGMTLGMFWPNLFILFSTGSVFLLLAYVLLRRMVRR